MSVNNGEKANENTFNSSFVSKEDDSTVVSKITLNRTGSGAQVDDVQQDINTNKTDIATNRADIDSNDVELADHESRITTNEGDITSIQNDLATDTMDLSTNQTAAGEKTFSNNVTINADLNVTGTIASVNDLEVDDNVITVNKNGNDASSEGAGLEVERTGTNGTFAYKNALDNKWEIGEVGNLQEVSGIVKDTLANLQALVSPSSSNLYFATDTLEHFRSDGTDLQPLGSGGGGGGLDNWLSEDFETTVAADFSTGNNATFLGAGTLDGALSDETTNPLSGDSSLKYVAGSSSLNDYFASPVIDVNPKQQENDSGFTFYFTWDGSTDIECVIWDETNSVKLNSVLDVINTADGATRYSASFYPPSTCSQVRYGFHILEAPTSGDILIVDDIEFSTNPFQYKDLIEEQTSHFMEYLGYGSSALVIPYFQAAVSETGSGIYTITNNSTDGFILTALKSCRVSMNINGYSSGSLFYGITKNTTQPSTSIDTLTNNNEALCMSFVNGWTNQASCDVELEAGDQLRPHSNGNLNLTTQDLRERGRITIHAQTTTEHVVTPAKSNMTDWISFTPTGAFTTNTTYTGRYRRVGQDMEIEYMLEFSGAPNNVACTIDMPSGFVMDDSVLLDPSIEYTKVLGTVGIYDSSAAGLTKSGSLNYLTNTSFDVHTDVANATYLYAQSLNITSPITIAAGDKIFIQAKVPIEGWTSDVTFLAAVPVQKVAVIERRGAGTFQTINIAPAQTLTIDTLVDNGGFASLSSNQIMIPSGEYKINCDAYFYQASSGFGAIYWKLVNITDTVDYFGLPIFVNTTNYSNTSICEKLTITKSTIFEFQAYKTGGGTCRFGDGLAAPNDLHAKIIITKLR